MLKTLGRVEKCCGETCGDCGKVRVFNSYAGVFQLCAWGKSLHKRVYIQGCRKESNNYVAGKSPALFVKEGGKS